MASAAAVFAGKSVATAAISFLVNKAFAYLNDHHKADGVDEMKRRILLAVPKIQAVFDVVNPERVREESSALDAWLWQIRDAVEKAEDALDEIEYYELEEKAKDRKVSDWGSSFAKMKHKAVKSVKHSSIVDKAMKFLIHPGTLKRLRKAIEGLDKAAAGFADFLALTDYLKGHTALKEEGCLDRDRETGSMLTETEVFGRHKEKELVVGWLTKTSDQGTEISVSCNHVSVFSVVGHGGMGKTTLAQLVCQEDAVKKHFEKVIWVCVSTSFDVKTVISNILKSAKWAKSNADTLEALQQILREKLNSVKFFLVLDNVWEDKKDDQFKKLFAPLRTGKTGSKILLTTRMQSVADLVADVVGGQKECIALQGLKEDENIKLFNRHAFPHASLQDYTALQPIGEQIAKNVRGYPLVTKVVASHLRGNLNFQYWNSFLHQRLEHFEGSADDIMNVLKLSYYNLPTEMQTCFRYCSIFPQDYQFSKDQLVEMWMSSGLISQAEVGSQSQVDIGEQYLVQLTRKSFFDFRFYIDHLGQAYEENGYYVMHDLMHDLAKYVSLGECARIVDAASLENVARTIRHIRVEGIINFPMENIKKITQLEYLRTIIIEDEHKIKQGINTDLSNVMEKLVESSKSLRLFETSLCLTLNFPGKHSKLKHLRFIKLPRISPEGIFGIVKLYHLTTLECGAVKIEPKQLRDVGNLDRLRNVTYGSYGCGNFPVGRLHSLRILRNYCIQAVKGHTISALKDLRNLRELHVEGLENVSNQQEAKEAKLKEKQYLESVCLSWSECNGARSRTDELILDNLEPHGNLKNLYISGFSGTRMPHWIAKPPVRNLVRLEFKKCGKCEQLLALEKLVTLKHLKLEDLPRLKKIGQALSVSGDECIELFLPPSLDKLVVKLCPELGELPLLPPSLVSLKIEKVGLINLPRIGKLHNENAETVSSQLRNISVEDCQSLITLEGSLFEQKQYMGVLRFLRIVACVQLESAPAPFEEMNRLEVINISNCPKLRTLGGTEENLLPSSLRVLTMLQCGEIKLALLGSLQGLTNLWSLELHNCSAVESLPSADVFKSLKSLGRMELIGCGNLSSLGGLGSLPFLVSLLIRNCCKLAEAGLSLTRDASGGGEEHPVASTNSLQIVELSIDLPSLLLVEPLNGLCQTKHLKIWGGSEMESVPEGWLLQNRSYLQSLWIYEAKSLESLPPSVQDLSSLEYLALHGAGKLQSLPDLPSSLKVFRIEECHSELEKKYGEYGSLNGTRFPIFVGFK